VVVQSLLDAGMISTFNSCYLTNGVVLGKSNMTALGNYYQLGIPNGWSPMGGQVLSPFGADFNTGGSSTGSAVALAAGFTAAAVGAKSLGSIVSTCFVKDKGAISCCRRRLPFTMRFGV
jgi:hypothetical protein